MKTNEPQTVKLSEFVKEKRAYLGYTQVEFAKRAGVGLRFLRDLEQGKTNLQMESVNKVLFMFGHKLGPVPLSMEDRIGTDDEKSTDLPDDDGDLNTISKWERYEPR